MLIKVAYSNNNNYYSSLKCSNNNNSNSNNRLIKHSNKIYLNILQITVNLINNNNNFYYSIIYRFAHYLLEN